MEAVTRDSGQQAPDPQLAQCTEKKGKKRKKTAIIKYIEVPKACDVPGWTSNMTKKKETRDSFEETETADNSNL